MSHPQALKQETQDKTPRLCVWRGGRKWLERENTRKEASQSRQEGWRPLAAASAPSKETPRISGRAHWVAGRLTFDLAESPDAQRCEQSVVTYLHSRIHGALERGGAQRSRPVSSLPSAAGGADVPSEGFQPIPVGTNPPNTTGALSLPRNA